MDYPNEIIVSASKLPSTLADRGSQEWPVCLLRWKDKANGILDVASGFRTFVRPTWRPELTEFCTRLTGITQVRAWFTLEHHCRGMPDAPRIGPNGQCAVIS